MMELHWDYSEPESKSDSPEARDEATIAELELGLQEAAATDSAAVKDNDAFVRQWMAERLSTGL